MAYEDIWNKAVNLLMHTMRLMKEHHKQVFSSGTLLFRNNIKKNLLHCEMNLQDIYRGITAMKELFHQNTATFSSQFLQSPSQQHIPSNVLRISIADELKLSDDRKTTAAYCT